MRESLENWFLVFGIIVLMGLIFFLFLPKRTIEYDDDEVLGVTNLEEGSIPYIVSVPREILAIGEEFEYVVEVSDLDVIEESIVITLVESPEWMFMEDNIIKGIPSEPGTYKFVVNAFNGLNSTSQINYILVEDYE